jgi:hypothetical protein
MSAGLPTREANGPAASVSIRCVVLCLAGVVLFIALFPLSGAGFAVPDDFVYSLWVNAGDRWAGTWGAAKLFGRFIMPFHIGLNFVPYLVDGQLYLKTVQIGSIVAVLVLFAHALGRYMGERYYGLLAALLFPAFLQNMWEHHIYAAYPFVFQFGGCFLILSLLAFKSRLEGGSRRQAVLTGALLFVSFLTYEAFVPYVVLFLLIAWRTKGKDGLRAVLSAILPVLVSLAVYVQIYLLWRNLFPSQYTGSQITWAAGSLLRGVRVMWQLAISSVPGYVFAHFDSIHYRFAGSPEGFGRDIGSFLASLRVEWLIKAAAVGIGVWLVQRLRAQSAGRPRVGGALAVGALLFVAPPLPLALTPKYQEWIDSGMQGYVVTYFSYFGVIVLATAGAAWLAAGGAAGSWKRRGATAAVCALAVATSLVTDYGNAAMHRSQALHAYKWKLFRALISSRDFAEVPPGSCVLLDGLTATLAFGANEPRYWQALCEQTTGRTMSFSDQREAFLSCMGGGARQGMLVRYRQEENVANQFIALGRVLAHEQGRLLGDRVVVLSSGYARRLTVLVHPDREREPLHVSLNGREVAAQESYYAFPLEVDASSRAPLRTEIRQHHLILDSVALVPQLD